MTGEERQLLLADLCARLPYGVNINLDEECNARLTGIDEDGNLTADIPADFAFNIDDIKPYLRPMGSMTDTERLELSRLTDDKFKFYLYTSKPEIICYEKYNYLEGLKVLDWLIAHHFDIYGLIEKGLALPAPDGMYNGQND